MCKHCIATPAAERRKVKLIMELCKRCKNTYTYEDGPDVRPSYKWTLCPTCQRRESGVDESACGCELQGCYFCFGGTDGE